MMCLNCPLEVGSKGAISERNSGLLAMVASMWKIIDVQNLERTVGKICPRRLLQNLDQTEIADISGWSPHATMSDVSISKQQHYLNSFYMNPCKRRE